MLLVVSQTGLVYTFTTPKLEAVVKQPEGRNLIQECLNAPDPADLATNQAEAGPSSTPFQRDSDFASADIVDEQDDDDEEEEDGVDIGQPDAGFTAQAIGTMPIGSNPNALGAGNPLFHPGWAPSNMGLQTNKRSDAGLPASSIKRRRTQPNLSRSAAMSSSASVNPAAELSPNFYHPSSIIPMMPMNRVLENDSLLGSGVPMFFGQPSLNQDGGPLRPSPSRHDPLSTQGADGPMSPQSQDVKFMSHKDAASGH